jgi:hypothetical protein
MENEVKPEEKVLNPEQKEELKKEIGQHLKNKDKKSDYSLSGEEAVARTIDYLNKPHNINYASDLTLTEIKLITRIEMESHIYGYNMLSILTKKYKELKVSKNRLGRLENIDVIKYYGTGELARQGNIGIGEKLKTFFT